MKFTNRNAHEAYKDQAILEYRLGRNQSMMHNSKPIPITNEIAYI